MRWLVAVAVLGAQSIPAAPLDDIIALALDQSAELTARRVEAQAISRQSGWQSELRLAANARSTREQAAGLDAGVTLTIPLFDRRQELEAAQARYQVAVLSQDLRQRLTADIATLVEQAGKVVDATDLAAFQRDRLAYAKQAVAEGRETADSLWSVAKAVRDAMQAAVAAEQTYAMQLETLARTWGGGEWTRLRDLLAAHVRRNWPSMPSPAAATSW